MPFINIDDLNKIMDALMSRDELQCIAAQAIVVTAKDHVAPGHLIDAAISQYASDDIEIDDDAAHSQADKGDWVSAWVYIERDDVEDEDCETCANAIETRPFPCDECGHNDQDDSEDDGAGAGCALGLHSWVNDPSVTSGQCTHCGTAYGEA